MPEIQPNLLWLEWSEKVIAISLFGALKPLQNGDQHWTAALVKQIVLMKMLIILSIVPTDSQQIPWHA